MDSTRRPFAMLTSSSSSSNPTTTARTSNNNPNNKQQRMMIVDPPPPQPRSSLGSPPISPICYSSENQFGEGMMMRNSNNWGRKGQQQQQPHHQYNYRHEKQHHNNRADNNATTTTSRAFGRMLQTAHHPPSATTSLTFEKKEQGSSAIMMRPNPHERLWNPSPSKKARSSSSTSSSSGVGGGGRVEGKGSSSSSRRKPEIDSSRRSKFFPNITVVVNDKPATTTEERYQHEPQDYIIPIVVQPQQTPLHHLNNSFTEKISNLDIGCSIGGGGEYLPESPVPPTSSFTDLQQGPNVGGVAAYCHSSSSSNFEQEHEPRDLEVNKENEEDCILKTKNNRQLTTASRGVLMETSSQSSAGSCSEFWHEHLDPDYPYITEILNYWHVLESEHRVDPEYMEKQKEISFKMRSILVDWLVEVVEEYSLCNATLHRCVQFIDRFLSKLQISRSNLQLVGTACLFIACKVEEIQPPETGDLIYITDNTYEKSQLLHMECLVLSVLDFDLLTPTAYEFTEYFASALYLGSDAKEFSFYVVELTLLQGEKFLQFSPSMVGVAGVYVGMWCCGDSQHVCGGGGGGGRLHHRNRSGGLVSNNNKMKSKRSDDNMSVRSVLSRIKRLNLNSEFVKIVEDVVSQMFVTVLSVSSYNCGGSSSSSVAGSPNDIDATTTTAANSVCTKYRKFQDQKYFRAATSAAACFSC